MSRIRLEDLPDIPIDINEYRKWKERQEKAWGPATYQIPEPPEETDAPEDKPDGGAA